MTKAAITHTRTHIAISVAIISNLVLLDEKIFTITLTPLAFAFEKVLQVIICATDFSWLPLEKLSNQTTQKVHLRYYRTIFIRFMFEIKGGKELIIATDTGLPMHAHIPVADGNIFDVEKLSRRPMLKAHTIHECTGWMDNLKRMAW